jgi:hypothetical protein
MPASYLCIGGPLKKLNRPEKQGDFVGLAGVLVRSFEAEGTWFFAFSPLKSAHGSFTPA